MCYRFLLLPFLLMSLSCLGQSPLRVDRDSVKFIGAEFVLRNQSSTVPGYLYNTGNGRTVFRPFGHVFRFSPGMPGFPAAGDTIYQNPVMAGHYIKVIRNGLLQYESETQGVKIDATAGKVVFYPALLAGDAIFIEALAGVAFNDGGTGPGPIDPPEEAPFRPHAGVFAAGRNAFSLRWADNARVLYLGPKIVGVGSSTLAGQGLAAPFRLEDRITRWLANNTAGGTFTNLAVGGFSSNDVLPAAAGGSVGKNIEAALRLNPDLIFVSLPSNDPSAGLSVAQSMTNFRLLDALAQRQGVPVFFETTQPRTNYTSAQRQMLRELADSIRAAWPTRYVEGYTIFVDPNNDGQLLPQYDSGDGVHLNAAGVEILAEYLFSRWMGYFTPIRDVRNYVIDSSADNSQWGAYANISDPNTVKQSFARYGTGALYYRVRALMRNGSWSEYSPTAVLEAFTEPEVPGVEDFDHRVLIDLGGDGVQTLNGSSVADGKLAPSPDGFGKHWNNWTGTGAQGFVNGSGLTKLKTAAGDQTPMSIQLIGNPTGSFVSPVVTQAINYNGFTTGAGDYPMEALYDNMFIHSTAKPDSVILRIRGLNAGNTYYIKLWGARRDANSSASRILLARLAGEPWAAAQSVDTWYPATGTAPDYDRAIQFNHITGTDSLDIFLRTGAGSAFAHVSLVDVGIMGALPPYPQLRLRDSTTTLSTMTMTALPINGAAISSFNWSQVSGPNTVTIVHNNTATAQLSGLTNGTFVFRVQGMHNNSELMTAEATVRVFPDNGGKKTLRVHFSKTPATPIPGWFNIAGVVTTETIVATDPATGWTIDAVSPTTAYWQPFASNSASNTDGTTTGNNSGVVPDIVLQGYWFNYSLKYAPGADNLLVKGLNPAKTYTLRFVGARGSNNATAPRSGSWRVNGGPELLQNAFLNTSQETVVTGVSPDAGGVIRLSVHAPTSAATNGNYSYLNGLIVQEE